MIPAEKYPLNLTCSVFQFGRLTGRIELLRKERGGKREQYAYVDQLKKGCGRKNFSAGHDIVCGAGTESAINYRRDYIFLFYKIRKADFVFWTCSTAEKYSKTINLMPFSKLFVYLCADIVPSFIHPSIHPSIHPFCPMPSNLMLSI